MNEWNVKIRTDGGFILRFPKPIMIIFLILSLCCCQRAGYKLFSNVKLQPTSRKGSFASKETMEGLLYEIWDSGFIRKNVLTKKEILDNAYGIFRKAPEALSDPEGRAFYQNRKGKKDLLMLNANLFGHLEPAPKQPHIENVRVKKLDKGIRPTLVHELFHDFWYDILDQRKRFLFSVEAEIFFMELFLAKSEQEKHQFLREFGIGSYGTIDFESFEVLREIQDIYRLEKWGTEIFAILAGRAYSGKTVIPKPFKKYYAVLLSDEVLDRAQFSSPSPSGQRGKIQAAKQAADLAALKTSLEKNPDQIISRDENGFTPLHHAAYSGNLEAAQLLIEKGTDLDAKATGLDWTALFLASLRGHKQIAEFLIDNGAYTGVKDAKGRSPVHIAALRGHQELIGLFLRHGARIHSQDNAGMTPLHMAALYGEEEAASFLISNGANTKAKDIAGQTPLHLASFCGDRDLIKLLIAGGADIDDRDHNGETALHLAAFCGHENVVEWLIECGAKSDIENNRGENPGEMASKAGHKKIVEILSSATY